MYVGLKACRALRQWAGHKGLRESLCCPRQTKAQEGRPGSVFGGPQQTHFEGRVQAALQTCHVWPAVAHSLTVAICSLLFAPTFVALNLLWDQAMS